MRSHLFNHGHRHTLLIVAGSPMLARALSEAAHEDFEITCVTSRSDALRARSSSPFDGYVVDAHLPDGDGAGLVHELRDDKVTVPVLFLESLSGGPSVRGAADASLTKPLSLEDFRSSLRGLFLPDEAATTTSASRARRFFIHPAVFLIPVLLAAGIALTCWILALS